MPAWPPAALQHRPIGHASEDAATLLPCVGQTPVLATCWVIPNSDAPYSTAMKVVAFSHVVLLACLAIPRTAIVQTGSAGRAAAGGLALATHWTAATATPATWNVTPSTRRATTTVLESLHRGSTQGKYVCWKMITNTTFATSKHSQQRPRRLPLQQPVCQPQ